MAGNIKKNLVIDASFALGYLLPDERAGAVDEIFQKHQNGRVRLYSSFLFPFEVLNGLRTAVLRKRLEEKTALKLAKAFLSLGIRLETVDLSGAFRLSLDKNLSVYDAAYLQLARAKNIPLLSLDRRLTGKKSR